MTILCLCREEHHWKLIPGYAEAFRRRGIEFVCVEDSLRRDAALDEVVRSSGVFDHVAVFHPGYAERFAAAGHPGAFLLPHAVRKEFFDGGELEREFEIGWVGQTTGPFYQARAEWLPKFAKDFRTNNWSRAYTVREVAETYRRSKIVVNIGRDDFPQDGNLRVFEVLASGALLLTSLPSELEQLGFSNGAHFVGYRDHADINQLVRHYLDHEQERSRIAASGRELVLAEHTYDRRAEQLLARLALSGNGQQAPARNWSDARARLVAMDFYAAHGLAGCAAGQFRHIAGRGFRETIEAVSLLSRASLRSLRGG
jgi:glycosyltransferase involved in cell wall biosynthesis